MKHVLLLLCNSMRLDLFYVVTIARTTLSDSPIHMDLPLETLMIHIIQLARASIT